MCCECLAILLVSIYKAYDLYVHTHTHTNSLSLSLSATHALAQRRYKKCIKTRNRACKTGTSERKKENITTSNAYEVKDRGYTISYFIE